MLTNATVGDETETKEVVVKRGEYKENPQSGKVQLVYNEHVELIEVPIKPSDRLKLVKCWVNIINYLQISMI